MKENHCEERFSSAQTTAKFSLKMRRKVTQPTDKSTVCYSMYGGGSTKTSIKNLLFNTRSRIQKSQHFLNLKYQDIKVTVIHKPKHFLTSVLCTINRKNQEEGCQCSPKCLWVDRWLSLSAGYPKYKFDPTEEIGRETEEQIRKDLNRTQPDVKVFCQEHYLNALFYTLTNYAKIDKEVGYVQGMNMIGCVFVYHGKNMYECDELMRFLMVICNFRQIYLNEFQLAHKCADLVIRSLRFRCHDLYNHLIAEKEISLHIFLVGWLLAMLGNVVPLEYMHLVINNFIEKRWNGLLNIILTLLIYMKEDLMELEDELEVMEKLSINSLKKMTVNWEQIIVTANNVHVIKQEFN